MRRMGKSWMTGSVLLILGIFSVALLGGRMRARHGDGGDSPEQAPATARVVESRSSGTGGLQYTFSFSTDREQDPASRKVWEVLQEILEVERIAPYDDPEQRARSAARQDFHRARQRIRDLRSQGFGGEELYAVAEQGFVDEEAQGALEMLDGYRRLEQDLDSTDLDGMTPEERFAYVVEARRDAFGEETAEDLFFEKEAYTRYKLEEKAIVADTDLTELEKRAEIIGRRNTLQVELASRGSYVSFADERRNELDRKLRERFGANVEAMSEEERRAAVLELYREELPPEALERIEQVLAAQAARQAALEAYLREREAVLNDRDLSSEDRRELLEALSTEYDTGGRGREYGL